MQLTAEQISILQTAVLLFIFNVGLLYILRTLYRKVKNIYHSAKVWFIRRKNKRKKKHGYKNYKGDTWFPDGTYYNSRKKKLESPDYRNK